MEHSHFRKLLVGSCWKFQRGKVFFRNFNWKPLRKEHEMISKKEVLMKRFLVIGMCVIALLTACGDVAHGSAARPSRPHFVTCTLTGLTGAAAQENNQFCSVNSLTNVTTDCCGSVYKQAIHLAQKTNVVIGFPTSLSFSINWAVLPQQVTWVWFSSGVAAWHNNPSNGIATIWDPIRKVVLYSGT